MKGKKIITKISAAFLSLLLLLSGFFQSGGNMYLKNVDAASGTAKVALSRVMTSNKISVLDRPASEGLWKITAGGKQVFCLNSGKSMCTGDTATYKTYLATTYSKQSIAKALTYWYGTLGGSGSTKKFSMVQAYIWACGKGVSKKTAVYQAAKNIDHGYTSAEAQKFCKKIADTDPEGTIYYYTITKCARGKKHSAHQVMYGWKNKNASMEKAELNYCDKGSEKVKIPLSVVKKDAETGKGLEGATFELKCDGAVVATKKTDANGKIFYTHSRTNTTRTYSSSKKYIKNWKELTVSQQKKATANGYYSSKAKATSAAKAEVDAKIKVELAKVKSNQHVWTVTEITPPFGHLLAGNKSQTKTETAGAISFSFLNGENYVNLNLKKGSVNSDYGVEATLANAVYGVYAADTIYKTDNKTTAFKKDALVTKITTNVNGEGMAEGLLPGRYYLKELSAPKGFLLDEEPVEINLTDSSKTVTVKDENISGRIRITKTFGDDKEPEEGAVFELYNAKDELADTITINTKGIGTSKELPYGSYRLHQKEGKEGYEILPDQMIKIDVSSDGLYLFEANDEKEYAGIAITKSKVIDDKETETCEKSPEEGAAFELIKDKKVVETITTNEKGVAKSKELEPGNYTVHQVKGSDNFAFIKDFNVTITKDTKKLQYFSKENNYNGQKLRIHKTKVKNGKSSVESGAEFVVLDTEKVPDMEKAELSTEEEREKFLGNLDKKAVLGTIITDSNGDGTLLLDRFTGKKGFVVLQTKGADGYLFANPWYSAQHKPKDENGISVYEFEAADQFDDYAMIKVKKQMTTSETETSLEANAKFDVLDINGDVVTTLTTGKNGEAVSIPLSFGIYVLHQTDGANKHLMMEDEEIVLSKDNKHKEVLYEFTDKEKPITFKLIKNSSETKKLLNGAVYELINQTTGEVVKLITGADGEGMAEVTLPFGEYRLKEIEAPDGYNKNSEEKTFTLNLKSVDYDKDGNGTYVVTDTDTPILGEISLTKGGEVMTGYVKESQGFEYETALIEGAEYGLYAKEDITKDDGTVVWKAGTLIDKKTTDKAGNITFTRKDAAGKETKNFYLGIYYVREISVPYGYKLDPEEHEVVLTWDSKAKDLNDIRGTEDVDDVEDPFGNNTPYPNQGIYVLEEGSDFNEKIKDAETITFTWKTAPSGIKTTDVSQNKDGSVVLWSDGDDYYVSSQHAGQVIYFNAVSSHMFEECLNLTEIKFKNVDTSGMVDASYMFCKDTNLVNLDISSFNTANVENETKMFYACTSLKTVYAYEQDLAKADEAYEENDIFIEAVPKTDFMAGDKFKAENFEFRLTYDNDGEEQVDVTDADVTFNPVMATKAGKMKVQITFKSSSKYAKYKTIETEVNVLDIENVALKTIQKAEVHLDTTDALQKYAIHVIKTDQNGKNLEGATFALKAACEIVNSRGETVFQKGDTIAVTESPDSQFEYLEFFNLPTDLYAKNKGTEMFTVEETDAPLGYYKSNEVLHFKAEALNDKTENFIHDVTKEGNVNDEITTFIHDSKSLENEKIPYISLKKYWHDNDNRLKKRPVSLTITAKNNETGAVKTYALNQANDWMAVTDIEAKDKNKYTFTESSTAGYTQVGKTGWDNEIYVVSFTNKYVYPNAVKNISVEKTWDDHNDQDGIRPESITVKLYKNGKYTGKSDELSSDNNWTTSFKNLPAEDEAGEEIEYEIREESDLLTGDAKTGYSTEKEVDDSDPENVKVTLTNRYNPKTVKKSIQKVWDDHDNVNGIRPDHVTVNLLGDSDVVETLTLNSDNKWKAESKILPVNKNGKEIKYSWEEVKDETNWITGESNLGYKASYTLDSSDKNKTILTNKHERTTEPGKITLYKEIDPDNVSWMKGSYTFNFSLTGTTIYGRKYSETKEVAFTKEDVKEHPKLSVTFDNLEYGTYTVKESGEEKYFTLDHITTSDNAKADKTSVSFDIGPENTSGDEALTGSAVFVNKMYKGTIKLKKFDSKGNKLTNVTFALKNSDGSVTEEKTTDSKGELTFTELLPDAYTITEVKGSKGSSILKEPLKVNIPLSMSKEEAEKENADISDAVKVGNNYYFYHQTYEVTNSSKLDLPKTGWADNLKTYIPLVAGIGIFTIGVYIVFKRKHSK